ncbi:smpA / OmlA family protein [Enterobacteriaceae bacterium ATCC 29904]|nr:smpA / OmlA family protein [Enterobacteriaceae bacterium ATCC 29904]
MMNCKKMTRLALLMGSMALLTACTRAVSNVNGEGKTDNAIFPDKSHAVRTDGSFVNKDNLNEMRAGLTKAQIYELLGAPHFSEGMFRVKEWDYIFHFTQPDRSVRTCQYKVLFDSQMKAQSFYFLPENCLTPQAKPQQPVAVVQKELSAESLFAFGSAALSPEGIKQVNLISGGLKAETQQGKHLIVKGHTDRIGDEASNMTLSKARAESVKRQLIENGIDATRIETEGLGESMPRVDCPGVATSHVIECLAPNRRMTIEIVADNAGK